MPDRYVDPLTELGGLLLNVEKPGRYTGGEYGIIAKKNAAFRCVIAFPDLYEIGMVNQALRVIYNRLNSVNDISCDRAFAPAPDFEKLLRAKNVPLYGLDTGLSLRCFDLLMFTMGYELGLNGVLLTLDLSGIPLRRAERKDDHPIVLAGGPAVSNPLPFSPFIDAFWIGEAEAGFFDLAGELALMKTKGKGRAETLEKISSHSNIWINGKKNVTRAVHSGFSSDNAQSAVYPIPSMKITQHHGSVEIMRGCPNGCRFCHAGFWYRPARQKKSDIIFSQVNDMVTKGGWREISLSSLSSGDYHHLGELIENLNESFSPRHVSFQLPSLKISGFSLDILEKISVTRKSGLTFAIETPRDAWQMSINKEVSRDSVISILEEAKKKGWKSAKFYFMIGLPLPQRDDLKSEEEEIVEFITDIGRKTRVCFNINVGIFIPKPHTPYQMESQIESEKAEKKLDFIRAKLKPLGHKVSVADTLISRIEGMLSRGDERAGLLCEEAYLGGSRLDTWNEYINRDIWRDLINANQTLLENFLSGKDSLPWEAIDSRVNHQFFLSEKIKSDNLERTLTCVEKCSDCGVCAGKIQINKNSSVNLDKNTVNITRKNKSDPDIYRMLFSFSKKDTAVFHGHLSVIEIFSSAFRRAGIPVNYTKGFNPIVKMEFASPLSTGVSAEGEIALIDFYDDDIKSAMFEEEVNTRLPQGIRVETAKSFFIPSGKKKHSLSSLLWGFAYYGTEEKIDYVRFDQEKFYRNELLKNHGDQRSGLFYLRRKEILAKDLTGKSAEWVSYFDVYKSLYPDCN